MRKVALTLALAVPLVAFAASADHAAKKADEDAVRAAVQHYFDGMMNASPEDLRIAFHPESRLIGAGSEGGIMIIPFERWASSWEGREPRDLEKYKNEIVSIDMHGTAASVKTDLVWPNVRYIDYLSLLKIDGEWKIVNKIWTEEAPPDNS
jgi:hypothetical protein